MQPICRKCHLQMACKQNDFLVADRAQGDFRSTYWLGDLWKCSRCGAEIVTGFGLPTHHTQITAEYAAQAEIFEYE